MRSKRGIHRQKPCKTIRIGQKLYLFKAWGETKKGQQYAWIQHILSCTDAPYTGIKYKDNQRGAFQIKWPIRSAFTKVVENS